MGGEVVAHDTCSTSNLEACVSSCGFDVVGVFPAFTNGFGVYIPQTGVTTPGQPSNEKCLTSDVSDTTKTYFPWTVEKQGCFFNGPYWTQQACQSGVYSKIWRTQKDQYNSNLAIFHKYDYGTTSKTVTLKVSDIGIDPSLVGGKETLEVAIGLGHGVFDGQCGDVALLRSRDVESADSQYQYVVNLQVDIRSWSMESSALLYLGQSGYKCYGGACCKTDARTGKLVAQAVPDIIKIPDTVENPAFTRIANALAA